ncbi:unnamed protein product, partial [Ectocarpus sp. 8 AP-2014]
SVPLSLAPSQSASEPSKHHIVPSFRKPTSTLRVLHRTTLFWCTSFASSRCGSLFAIPVVFHEYAVTISAEQLHHFNSQTDAGKTPSAFPEKSKENERTRTNSTQQPRSRQMPPTSP